MESFCGKVFNTVELQVMNLDLVVTLDCCVTKCCWAFSSKAMPLKKKEKLRAVFVGNFVCALPDRKYVSASTRQLAQSALQLMKEVIS
jgi:hypothetical protein